MDDLLTITDTTSTDSHATRHENTRNAEQGAAGQSRPVGTPFAFLMLHSRFNLNPASNALRRHSGAIA